jgi:D-3-phosphoglycerate dehydrogenase / 2-oxoglutarate reductase
VSSETSFPKDRIKVLLLENVSPTALEVFAAERFQVEALPSSLSSDELGARIADVHILGIRSKTRVGPEVLKKARRLLTLGCFCIGTNQVSLDAANARAVPVFNAPFSNTRSVAELMIAEIISLARQLGDRSREVHAGKWRKVAKGCLEVRGKTLGIVGYGHIGRQLGVLAESLGLRVIFHDHVAKLPMGNNTQVGSLGELLEQADFVSLHVPETAETKNLIGAAELGRMRPGAFLLNASRGTVVVIDALAEALRSGRLGGAAVDVYPEEPEGASDEFKSALQGLPNVILTPHIGGSTSEAQAAIGREVATALVRFVNAGATTGSVNFPLIEAPALRGAHRILNVHRNVPGVLSEINKIVSDRGANIQAQVLATDAQIGYLIMDLNKEISGDVQQAIAALPTNIRTRILF